MALRPFAARVDFARTGRNEISPLARLIAWMLARDFDITPRPPHFLHGRADLNPRPAQATQNFSIGGAAGSEVDFAAGFRVECREAAFDDLTPLARAVFYFCVIGSLGWLPC